MISMPANVGAGLQEGTVRARLSQGAPAGGLTVRITSDDPALAFVSPNANTAGQAFIDVFLPPAAIDALFFVQGLENVTGSATITASATGFSDGSGVVNIVQPGIRLSGLVTTLDLLDPDDAFTAQIGIPNGSNSNLSLLQEARTGGGGLTVTFANSAAAVGELQTAGPTGQSVAVQILENANATPSSVASGGVEFHPLGLGATVVDASIPGFVATTAAAGNVNVTAPTISLSVNGFDIGAGLQDGNFNASLSASQHGGVTMRIESADPTIALVSPNGSTAGSPFIEVPLANGQTSVNFFLQGIAAGTTQITASAPSFSPESDPVDIVQPGLRLSGLISTLDTLDPDDVFTVQIGRPNSPTNSTLNRLQAVRIGGPALTVTASNGTAAVGELVTSVLTGQLVTAQIQPGQSTTPGSVVSGGFAFSPLGAGVTTVNATIPGFISTTLASGNTTVTAPSISLNVNSFDIGAGLQDGNFNASLSASQHGGVTMRIESADPAIALVSPNSSTAGSAFIEVPLANGQTSVNFFLQGVAIGTTQITASAPGFSPESDPVDIVQPALRLSGLISTFDTLDPDDVFTVQIGRANSPTNSTLNRLQAVRIGGPALTVTANNSNAAVGELVTTALTAQSVTAQIQPGQSATPSSVVSGGFSLSPLSAGVTTVNATIPGFIATTAASGNTTVTSPTISLSVNGFDIGAGLQDGNFSASLSASQHGGVIMRIESADPTIALVSPNSSTAGSTFIEVPLANGQTSVTFFLQGVATGTTQITASAPGFVSESDPVDVVQPALRLSGLIGSLDTLDPDDVFTVQIGRANSPTNSTLNRLQAVRIGGAPLTVTINNGTAAVGELVTTALTGQVVTAQILPGQNSIPGSVAAGGVAFSPLGAGFSLVNADIPGFLQTTAAFGTVNVTAPAISMNVANTVIGAGLQRGAFQATLGASGHGGVTVRIESADPTEVRIAPNATTPRGQILSMSLYPMAAPALVSLSRRCLV